jgi:hypothetical protein
LATKGKYMNTLERLLAKKVFKSTKHKRSCSGFSCLEFNV